MINRIGIFQDLITSVFNRDVPDLLDHDDRSMEQLCDALLSERGEVSGNRIAQQILTRFTKSTEKEQVAFFQMLITRFDIDTREVQQAANSLNENNTVENLGQLLNCVEPKRQELFRRLNRTPGATERLVQMRASLLKQVGKNEEFARIDIDFQKLFRAWFNAGFLVLREIDWHTPANILEKLIAYEAVHAINSWDALRRRLAPNDRKCYAFFHPSMLDEPLIFVEVALTKESPDSIREILSENRESLLVENTDTAVFYSISTCQAGLAGVSFGNFLIKQVAQELSTELKNIKFFRTLSPVPGFIKWVDNMLVSTEDEELHGRLEVIKRIASKNIDALNEDEVVMLKTIAARYLVLEKRSDAQPLDAVARFHLNNGAVLDRILPQADLYKSGLQQSAGVMVSYLYDLNNVIENHERYATDREVVCSDEVSQLFEQKKKKSKRKSK